MDTLPIELIPYIFDFCDESSRVTFAHTCKEYKRHILKSRKLVSKRDICCVAAKEGHLDILKWLKEIGCELSKNVFDSDKDPRYVAAKEGHLHILKWLKENGYMPNWYACSEAAYGGHLEVLKWFIDNGCSCDVCYIAARGGQLHILKWARENGFEWNEYTCTIAAEKGHLEVLKWARENGCPWKKSVCSRAAEKGHLHVLKWAIENGCSYNYDKLIKYASKYPEMFKWLEENKKKLENR